MKRTADTADLDVEDDFLEPMAKRERQRKARLDLDRRMAVQPHLPNTNQLKSARLNSEVTPSSSRTMAEDEVADHDSDPETSSSETAAEISAANTMSECTRSIEIRVGSGEDQDIFHVPKVLLVRASDFLKKELDERTVAISLTYISPIAFSEFLFWLYHQDTHEAFGDATANFYDVYSTDYFTSCVVDLCILASKWKLVDVHNRCITILNDEATAESDAVDLAFKIYRNTKVDAPLRRYITMRLHMRNTTDSSFEFSRDTYGYLEYDGNDPTWSYRCRDYYSELFRLGSFNEGQVVGNTGIRPVPVEEYFMK
ncbi:hypothetical protein Vi05172_g5033 [Venturia inaequalis]|nr:hypothetical protein Vi05172_g5033 [Venturia inaequalis]